MAFRYVLACFWLVGCLVAGQSDTKYALLGETAILNADLKALHDHILWKHDGNNVVEFDGSQEKSFESYKGRVGLDYHSADLTLSSLQFKDSGLYKLEAYINSKLSAKSFQLEVIDKVAKPTISCKMSNASTSDQPGGQATLTCSSPTHDLQSLMKFQWSSNANIRFGPELVISLGGELDDHEYNCSVSNPLSQNSAIFTANDCYPDKKVQAGLIAGVVVALILVPIICFILCILYKKVCLRHEKVSDVECQEDVRKVKSSESEEHRVLLDRAPTLPSKQTLSHLPQNNDDTLSNPPHKEERKISRPYHRDSDEAYMNELRESIRRRSSSGSEKNKIQDGEIPSPSPAPDKPPRTFSDRYPKENGKANETEPSYDEEKEKVFEDNSNAELTPASSDHNDKVKMDADKLRKDIEEEKDDPADSENEDDLLSEENTEEDHGASRRPEVPQKSDLVRRFSALQKGAGENTYPRVIKKQAFDDRAQSGDPNELSDDQNSEKKKEENESAKPGSENDVQPPPVAKENSPLSPNSPKISPKGEHKPDTTSDELVGEPTKKSTGESASLSSEDPEKEEQSLPVATPENTDSELSVDKQQPPLTETESEVENLPK